MKTKNLFRYSLSFALVVAVLISICLSVLMWLNPAHYENNVQRSANNTANKSNINVKPIENVYSPTQMIQNKNNKQYLLINPSVNMVGEVQNIWNGYRNLRLSNHHQVSKSQLFKLLRSNNSLVFNYNSPITMDVFTKLFKHPFSVNGRSKTINRVVLPTNVDGKMELVNDKTRDVYQLNFSNTQLKALNKIITDNRITQNEVFMKQLNKNIILETKHSLSMPQYSYLSSDQAQNYYILRLLGDSQNFNVKRHDKGTTYNDQSTRQVSFRNNGNVNYVDDQPSSIPDNFNDSLLKNYKYMVNTGIDMNNIHFFDYNASKRFFDYRMYIEGFPLFGVDNEGLFRVGLNINSSLQMKFSLKSLQIPTPNNDKVYHLPSTETVLNNLYSRGIKEDEIQHIEIGYYWKDSLNSKLLVNLMPTWYLKINNQWFSYEELMTKG